jgi:endonuclease YncB( thermonuclease family)
VVAIADGYALTVSTNPRTQRTIRLAGIDTLE